MNKLLLYFHTIRFLKFKQIWFRVIFKIYKPKIGYNKIPKVIHIKKKFIKFPFKEQSYLGNNFFIFINKKSKISSSGWEYSDESSLSKLWYYNLHYFNFLNTNNFNDHFYEHKTLIIKWMNENKPFIGIGWDPYPTSLRIVNWIKWLVNFNNPPKFFIHSLVLQARWLYKRLELHLMANHLFANAKALIFVGVIFSGNEAKKWLTKGLTIIIKELNEQVLEDGGNFERSPMYHAIFLEDLLDIINLSKTFPNTIPNEYINLLSSKSIKMLNWLRHMKHPDGEISFFNDTAFKIASNYFELKKYTKRLKIKFLNQNKSFIYLRNSGYVKFDYGLAYLLVDMAPIGPKYNPGHSHADTLSFELSIKKKRLFVNLGTSLYEKGPVRHKERSTCSHNTVEIDGLNSSEVWDSFRVARRANPFNQKVIFSKNKKIISCSHDGYSRNGLKIIHHRKFILFEKSLIINDLIDGNFNFASAFYHLHPSVNINIINKNEYQLILENGIKTNFYIKRGSSKLINSYYSQEFGKRKTSKTIKVNFKSNNLKIIISWDA